MTSDSCQVLVLSASLRTESLNTQLARLTAQTIEASGHAAELATMREFDVAPYDADEEHAVGLPAGADELRKRLEQTDAFVIVSPEYNASMPGVLKNAIDWVSHGSGRSRSTNGTACCCRRRRRWSAATAGSGRCASRSSILERAIYPDMFSLAQAHTAFDGDRLANESLQQAPRVDARRLPATGRGGEAVPEAEVGLGRVPRRAPGAADRPRRVTLGDDA